MEQEAGLDTGGEYPVFVPYFMKEIVEQVSVMARKSKYVDQSSGVSARVSRAHAASALGNAFCIVCGACSHFITCAIKKAAIAVAIIIALPALPGTRVIPGSGTCFAC